MGIAVTTITGPSYWASALVNGDYSGLNAQECSDVEKWIHDQAPWHVVSTVEDSERFTWSYRLYDPSTDCQGGEVLDYVAHLYAPR